MPEDWFKNTANGLHGCYVGSKGWSKVGGSGMQDTVKLPAESPISGEGGSGWKSDRNLVKQRAVVKLVPTAYTDIEAYTSRADDNAKIDTPLLNYAYDVCILTYVRPLLEQGDARYQNDVALVMTN
ncbi:hypothetical protein KPH14_007347 [Odynerus spinipes]|uniref:Uncharacterized protein n=1 Tax=Odynerus spinipes TaxID=1348599 RepID=A0AAD9VIJ8_9HYME|nr:hypothetical protein KPH14_007347 [Odynerus spinipes]